MNPISILTESIKDGPRIYAERFDVVRYRTEDNDDIEDVGCIINDIPYGFDDMYIVVRRSNTPNRTDMLHQYVKHDQITKIILRPYAGLFVKFIFRSSIKFGNTYERLGKVIEDKVTNVGGSSVDFVPAITIQSLSCSGRFLIPLTDIIEEIPLAQAVKNF